MSRFPAISVHYMSVFQTAQRRERLVMLTDVQSYEALGHQFCRRGRETAVGYRLCSEGNGVRWMCIMLKLQEQINLSTSPSFARYMGYHHPHIGLSNSF